MITRTGDGLTSHGANVGDMKKLIVIALIAVAIAMLVGCGWKWGSSQREADGWTWDSIALGWTWDGSASQPDVPPAADQAIEHANSASPLA